MTAATADWVGLVLDRRYHVTAKLGQGGMGFVYRAHDDRLGCDVVLKVPRAAMLEDAEFRQRFQDEVRALVRLAHPHVVKVSDFGQHEGVPFAVMQYLPGGSLDDRRPKTPDGKYKPVHYRTLAEWLPSVADAIDFIHKQGYIHRDIKPANILFDAHRNAYISDFGVAKAVAGGKQNVGLTGAGMVLGTPAYMAPELVTGSTVDGRIDQYALAITVYEVLTGRVPFADGDNPMRTLMRRATEEPPPLAQVKPNTPPALSDAVARALAKDPGDRFPDCAAFARAAMAATTAPAKATPPRSKPANETPGPAEATTGTPKGVQALKQTAPLPLADEAPDRVFTSPIAVRPARAVRKDRPAEGGVNKVWLFGGLSAAVACAVLGVGLWMVLRSPAPPPKAPARSEQARTTNLIDDPAPPPVTPRPREDDDPAGRAAAAGPSPDRIEGLKANLGSVTLVAGGPAQRLEVAVERPGGGPVRVELEAPAGVAVKPAAVTLEPDQPAAAFDLTAAADAPAGTDAVRITARRGGESLSKHVPVFLKRRDVRVSIETVGEINLYSGRPFTLAVAVSREGGFAAPVALTVDATPAVEAARATVPGDQTRADLTLVPKADAPDGPTAVRVRATAPGLPPHELVVAARVVGLRVERAFAGSDSRVQCLAVAATGPYTITGHADGSVRLWNVETGERVGSVTKHDGPVLSVAFSDDGKQALSGGSDKTVVLWDVAKGADLKKFDNAEHKSGVWFVAFLPSGTRVELPEGPDRQEKSKKGKAKAKGKDAGGGSTFRLPDTTPVSQSQEALVYWNPTTSVPYRYGGRQTVTGTLENQKSLVLAVTPPDPDTRVRVNSAYSLTGLGGDVLTVYRGSTMLASFPGHGDVKAMALSADGRRAIAVGADGRLRLWDVRAQRAVTGSPWSPGVTATAVGLTPDGSQALVGGADGSLRQWKLPQ
jgi:serine/threonine protein kinase